MTPRSVDGVIEIDIVRHAVDCTQGIGCPDGALSAPGHRGSLLSTLLWQFMQVRCRRLEYHDSQRRYGSSGSQSPTVTCPRAKRRPAGSADTRPGNTWGVNNTTCPPSRAVAVSPPPI